MSDADNPDRNNAANNDAEILRSDPRQILQMKRWAIGAVVAIVLIWLLFRHWMRLGDEDLVMQRMNMGCYALSALLLAIAIYAYRYAQRIFRTSQYPPPEGWVLGDTRVLRGGPARMRGWEILACAIAFLLLAIYAAILPRSVDALLKPSFKPQVIQLGLPHG